MAEDTMEMEGKQQMVEQMPSFKNVSSEEQMTIMNMIPELEKNKLMALMETGLSFEDALEDVMRQFQNPPPQLRQDEMNMLRDLSNMPMSDADARMLQDAKDPQTGMPIRKFDFMNKSGALGAFGGEVPMRQGMTPEMREQMIMDRKRKTM